MKDNYSETLWKSMKKACKQVEREKGKTPSSPERGATVQDIVVKLSHMYSRAEIMGELERRNDPVNPMYTGELKPDTILSI